MVRYAVVKVTYRRQYLVSDSQLYVGSYITLHLLKHIRFIEGNFQDTNFPPDSHQVSRTSHGSLGLDDIEIYTVIILVSCYVGDVRFWTQKRKTLVHFKPLKNKCKSAGPSFI
jgi:hypothetical protein